jgi:hypothetical protein
MNCGNNNSSSLISHITERVFFLAGSMAKNMDSSSSEKNPFRHKFCLTKGTCSGKRRHTKALITSYTTFSYN